MIHAAYYAYLSSNIEAIDLQLVSCLVLHWEKNNNIS